MVHALLKIQFMAQPHQISDVKDGINLCEKITRKFPVTARAKFDADSLSYIVVSILKESENQVSDTFDKILKFCDVSEFGRVYESGAFVEQIDNLDVLDSTTEMEYDR